MREACSVKRLDTLVAFLNCLILSFVFYCIVCRKSRTFELNLGLQVNLEVCGSFEEIGFGLFWNQEVRTCDISDQNLWIHVPET